MYYYASTIFTISIFLKGLFMNSPAREAQYFFHTYKRIPLEIDRGEGMYLHAKDGRRYLDMFSGLAVNALGYAHPKIIEAITDQAKRYIHLSNYYMQEPQLQLAELLVKHSGYRKIFFSNSGTESIEGALKISRMWGSRRGKTTIISFSNAFHGRTMGALSIMDRPKYRDGFAPFLPNCSVVDFNNADDLRKVVNAETAALILEFIQGEGGVVPITPEFVAVIKQLKEKFGFLLVADEIQSGLGRTGKMFGFQHYDITPNIVVMAKPIGGGLPLGAILGNDSVADILEPGMHGTTFGGNPVACAAGVATVREIIDNGLMQNAEVMGKLLVFLLRELQKAFPALVKEVRGYGLMVGMELTCEGDQMVALLRERGILLNCTNANVLRFLPPLIVQEDHIRETVNTIAEIFRTLE